MKERIPALLLVFAVAVALILNARGKLVGAGSVTWELFRPDDTEAPSLNKWGPFALAFFGYLLAISFMNESETVWVTGVIALGALYWDAHTMGANGLIPTLFAPLNPGDGTSPFNPFGGGSKVVPEPSPK